MTSTTAWAAARKAAAIDVGQAVALGSGQGRLIVVQVDLVTARAVHSASRG